MIHVGNRYKPETIIGIAVYCGRGTPLGNPLPVSTKHSRGDVCDYYDSIFPELRQQANALTMLRMIYKKALRGDVTLVCSCYSKRCHCDTIKRFIDHFINKEER